MGSFAAGPAPPNNTRRSTAGGDARQQTPTGLGGLGMPDLEGMLGGSGMPDAASLAQLMQNPAISQMMQSILSNPQTLNQVSTYCTQYKYEMLHACAQFLFLISNLLFRFLGLILNSVACLI